MCVFHFMKDITQCNINTNSKHNSKLIDYGSKNKQPFTKDSTKEILKKFVILYSSSASFRENFNIYKLYYLNF